MVRTRFAPSPTGYMHIGNLRTALYEYLVAKHEKGCFILRIEDTDQGRLVEGSVDVIYNTMRIAGLAHDEGPDVGGNYGPYVQSERKSNYLTYAKQLIAEGKAYYCFCTKERLESLTVDHAKEDTTKYDRHCLGLSQSEIDQNLADGIPYVIRQKIPEGQTTFHDLVYGDITVANDELDDQVLIKSDGLPTYNFANVVDDHLMEISHVIRGNEYLSSTPKYNLLYEAFGWDIPTYMHLPPIMNIDGKKLSKRRGDASFEDLLKEGFLPDAIVNYIALLGWSPSNNEEFFTLAELIDAFDGNGISKSPSIFDVKKLTWMNGEYINKMTPDQFYDWILPTLKENIKRADIDLPLVASLVQSRIQLPSELKDMVDFIDQLPEYTTDLYVHKKMKTDETIARASLENLLPLIQNATTFTQKSLHEQIMALTAALGIKNSQMLWPLRTALSGKPTSPCGGIELLVLLGKDESIKRIEKGIALLSV